MYQKISEADDSAMLGNANGDFRCDPHQLIEGFADDFELALDTGTQQQVGLVVLERLACGEIQYVMGRLPDVLHIFARIMRHTARSCFVRRHCADRDSPMRAQ
jgi:hypothetical protein